VAAAHYLVFRLFSRADRRIFLYSPISSSSPTPHDAIISSKSRAATRMASSSALRLRFCAGMWKPSVSSPDIAERRKAMTQLHALLLPNVAKLQKQLQEGRPN